MTSESPRNQPPDGNLLASIPANLPRELFETLLEDGPVRIKRIVSRGHTSPTEGWWDQEENEWVLVLRGQGTLRFDNGRETTLRTGDHIFIPAHTRHRVTHTDPDTDTVWLAVFWR
ncbi:MAG: cupin domain-containing protein [Opitutales bacterium]|nr:cupin domain-containing protein [Opitutales bacterium]